MAGTPTTVDRVLALLTADAGLVSLLPGGIYDRELKRDGRGKTPAAWATPDGEPRPAAVVVDAGESANPFGPRGAALGFVEVWIYAPRTRNGRAAIAEAIERVRGLLANWRFPTGNLTGALIGDAGQRIGILDDPVDDARALDRVRFPVVSVWRVID